MTTYDDIRRDHEARIQREGFTLQAVFATEAGKPTWLYTMGLHRTTEHPELVIAGVGLPIDLGQRLLTSVGRLICDNPGEYLIAPDGRYDDLLDGLDVLYKWVHEARYAEDWFNMALDVVPYLQMLLPDEQNRFPDDPSYSSIEQPHLWEPA